MKEYHKIHSVYKRDERGKFMVGQYALPEFGYLRRNVWLWEEKVDGTNIRVMWDGVVTFGGKTDNAQIPAPLIKKLQELFPADKFRSAFDADVTSVCLYGEGYGAKIQKGGGNYKPDGVDFVLFDVKVGDWFLLRKDVEDVARKMGVSVVPMIGSGDLDAAIEMTKQGFPSAWGNFQAEGLILRPVIPLLARNGDRIITKLKMKDWR